MTVPSASEAAVHSEEGMSPFPLVEGVIFEFLLDGSVESGPCEVHWISATLLRVTTVAVVVTSVPLVLVCTCISMGLKDVYDVLGMLKVVAGSANADPAGTMPSLCSLGMEITGLNPCS